MVAAGDCRMTGIRATLAVGTALFMLGANAAFADVKRVERGPEKVTVATEKGQQGFWIEYEQYTYEGAKERIASIAGGKLTQAELSSLAAQINRGGKSLSVAEVQGKVNAMIKARPKPRPQPKPAVRKRWRQPRR